jgi:RNA polymerase sigma-70 factor (ECF subfamily)
MISSASFPDTEMANLTKTTRNGRSFTPNPEKAYDAELVRRFNGGDTAAFEEIVLRYRGKMFAVALSTLRNHSDAEEVAQDTFVRAYQSLSRFRGESSLASWLHCIAYNLSCNRYWYFFRRQRHQTSSLDYVLGERGKATIADLVASEAPDPLRETANREFTGLVQLCMGKLNRQQREILTLRNLLDYTYEEIAQRLGISLGTVKSRIARARTNLRQLLAETYAEGASEPTPSAEWFAPARPAGFVDSACGSAS